MYSIHSKIYFKSEYGYRIQSHYPDTEQTCPCLIILFPSAKLGSDKYQFDKLLAGLNCNKSVPMLI